MREAGASKTGRSRVARTPGTHHLPAHLYTPRAAAGPAGSLAKSHCAAVTSRRRGGARGRGGVAAGSRGGAGRGRRPGWARSAPEVREFRARPLGWRLRERGVRVGMSEQSTVPEQSAPDWRRAGFVLGVDVGSSMIRCHVYDRAARICGSSVQKVTRERASGQRV